MGIEVKEVVGWDADGNDEVQGIALVDAVTGQPLPLSIRALPDVDTAETFLERLQTDARLLTPDALAYAAMRFMRELRHPETAVRTARSLGGAR